MAIERIKKEWDKNKELEPSADPNLNLREILADKNNSELFGTLLDKKNENDLGQKLVKGELKPEDLKQLEGYRNEFVKILDDSKKVNEMLDSRVLNGVITRSPNLQTLNHLVGQDGIQRTVAKKLNFLAIEDKDHFDQIINSFERVQEQKSAEAEKDEEIKKICAQYSVSDRDLGDVLKIDDTNKRLIQIRGLIKKRMSFGGLFQNREISRRAEELDRRDDIVALLAEADKTMLSLGDSLSLSIGNNDEVRRELVSFLRGEDKSKREEGETEMSFKESKELYLSQSDLEAAWQRFVGDSNDKELVGRAQKNDLVAKGELQNLFVQNYLGDKNKKIKKKGFWYKLLEAFMAKLASGFDLIPAEPNGGQAKSQ
ncbi:MAG: hypothetical protein M1505_01225 [Patescibacteria group bacterium]|nr:hypothetical protein [Patescibacteria group bacterium]